MIRLLRPRTPNLVLMPRAPLRPYAVAVTVGLALGLVVLVFSVLLTRPENDSTLRFRAGRAGRCHDPRFAGSSSKNTPGERAGQEKIARADFSSHFLAQ
jgi:hypothetical protein